MKIFPGGKPPDLHTNFNGTIKNVVQILAYMERGGDHISDRSSQAPYFPCVSSKHRL